MSKGSTRRPEDTEAVRRNWPFPDRTMVEEPYGIPGHDPLAPDATLYGESPLAEVIRLNEKYRSAK